MNAQDIEFISTLIDDMALDKPIDWESYNYEKTKDLAITQAYVKYQELIENKDPVAMELGIVSMLAYLMLENAAQWIELMRLKKQGS
jgi:hypothetical protein